jgi:NADH-quinone oxidoreductase subunit J
MTTKPELKLGSHLLPGLAAVALFAVLAVTFLTASFGEPTGFPADAQITASIGYAMFNVGVDQVPGTLVESEGFLVAFILIAIVLDAALDGTLLLAKREESESFTAVLADGGRRLRDRIGDDEGGER